MSRAIITLRSPGDKTRAHMWIEKAPKNTRVEFKAEKRTLPQNDRMWAMLTDVSTQVRWHGKHLRPDDWKLMFIDALRRAYGEELRIVPNTDGTGFVNLSTSSSDLSKDEMTDLIELIFKFGSQHGVIFNDGQEKAA